MGERVVIYHGNCFDGFTAAWVCMTRTIEWSEATYIPARYGDSPPRVKGKHVLIVDFSYPRKELLMMRDLAASLKVLDHHKTAEADLVGLPFCIFDMDRSGAGIAWDELVGGRRPWLVDVIEDRDLWRFEFSCTRPAMAYIACQPRTFEAWNQLYEMGLTSAVEAGEHVQQYIDEYGRRAIAEMRAEVIGGHPVPTINLPYMNCSDHVNSLLDQCPDAAFAVGYFRRGDGRWQFSLRSRPDFDVSEVAKSFGGGGHAQAAGFEVERLPWERGDDG